MPAPDQIHTDASDAPTLYLLFAGLHGHDRRGTGDLVATLASPVAAREAFRQVRLQIPDRDGWAELTAVSAGGKAKRLSWFGRDRSIGENPAASFLTGRDATGGVARTAAHGWWRLGKRCSA